MRMVINTSPLLDPLTGVGNYISHLIQYFNFLSPENNYTYYYGFFTKNLLYGNKKIYQTKRLLRRIPFLMSTLRQGKIFFSGFHYKEFDIYFEPNFIPVNIKAKKTVTTIHDFSFHLYPQWHPKDRVGFYSKHFFKNINRSNRVITDSFYIKGEALNILNLSSDVVIPIHLGIQHNIFKVYDRSLSEKIRNKMDLPENFILYVGNIEPRKNVRGLLQAYLELPDSLRKELKLVLVGFEGWNNPEVMELLNKIGDDAKYMGYIQTKDLAYIYNLANLFIYPSLYEGFGLPPLEAMASGCPVVVSNVASLPEVCGDAAYYVNPYDVESIADGIYKVVSDKELRENLVQKGLERAKLFSWEKSAREHLKVFEEVLNS